MADIRRLRLLLPKQVRSFPADLAVGLGVTALAVLTAVTPTVRETPIRVVFALAFLFFVPGYALISALFPEEGGFLTVDSVPTPQSSIDGIERLAASLATSVVVTGFIGVLLNFTPFGVRFGPVVVATSGFTVAMSVVSARRRAAIPESDRYRFPYRRWLGGARSSLTVDSPTGVANIVVAVMFLLAVGAVAYSGTDGGSGEQFSEFYLLTETDEGEAVLDEYPENLTANNSDQLVVGVHNSEHEQTNYSVVVQIQRVSRAGDSPQVIERQELRRFRFSLAHNETWRELHELDPAMTGTSLRVQYLLFRGSPPDTPRAANAYRELHFWTNATNSGS